MKVWDQARRFEELRLADASADKDEIRSIRTSWGHT
jgi:hypothetical protein